jgi:hypothetical protein
MKTIRKTIHTRRIAGRQYYRAEGARTWSLNKGDVLDMPSLASFRPADLRAMADAMEGKRSSETRDEREARVGEWCEVCFGEVEALSLPQRGIRLLEEAAEAAQATGVDVKLAVRLMEYVWNRPVGKLAQELGGVGVTALALANAAGLSADKCEAIEVERILSKPTEHFTRRNQEKNAEGFRA